MFVFLVNYFSVSELSFLFSKGKRGDLGPRGRTGEEGQVVCYRPYFLSFSTFSSFFAFYLMSSLLSISGIEFFFIQKRSKIKQTLFSEVRPFSSKAGIHRAPVRKNAKKNVFVLRDPMG